MSKRKQEAEKAKPKKKKRRLRKLFFLAIIGGGVALARSEDLRSTVLDKLFGAEKEFNYTPPAGDSTTGSTPEA